MRTKNDELIPLFNKLKLLLEPYEVYFKPKRDDVGYYELWSEKEAVIAGRQRKEVYFAAIIIQKHYVGFYYMPVYAEPDIKRFFGEELLATLKGKSCFYIKKDDPIIFKQIEQSLKRGLKLFKRNKWV